MYLRSCSFEMSIAPRAGFRTTEHIKRIEKILKNALPKAEVSPLRFRDITLFGITITVNSDENDEEIKMEYENKIALILDTYKNEIYAWDWHSNES